VQTEVKESGRFERTLTVHLDEAELESAKDKAARKLSKEIKIKGFRPGKAPRSVVERMVGVDQLRSEAIEEAIPEAVSSAIDDNGLAPVTVPQVSAIRDADQGGIDVDVRITLWPELEAIPEFAGRTIEMERPTVTEDEIQAQFDALRNQFAELEGVQRPAGEGDFVMINLTVLRQGTPIGEASANDLLYEAGSHSFLPGLDEIVMGASAGDIREGEATLPPGFTAHGGSPVTLRVLVKEVRAKRLPELTDELVDDATEFETVAELREAVTENMLAYKVAVARARFEELVMEAAIADVDIEIPDGLLEAEVEARIHNLLHRLEEEKLPLADYLRITGHTDQTLLAEAREQARRGLATRILLEGIVKIEGVELDGDEYQQAIESIATRSGAGVDDVASALESSGRGASLTGDILRRKALDRLVAAATPVDAQGAEIDLTPIVPRVDEDRGEDPDEEEDGGQEPASPSDTEESR
jgi:trigger factor